MASRITITSKSLIYSLKYRNLTSFRSNSQFRNLHASIPWFQSIENKHSKIHVHFITKDGDKVSVIANEGDSILDIAHENDIDLEGACEGSVACSTCHVILPQDYYDKLEEPTDEENDMLDLAFGLTDTSRLGCQVKMRKDLDNISVTLPKATRNMYVDGAKPHHH